MTARSEQAERTREILRHIGRNIEFAQIVRTITVRARAHSRLNPDIRILEDAFKCLSDLESLTWISLRPPLPPVLWEHLVKGSGHTIVSLRIPVSYYTDLSLPCFTNIRRLELDGDDDMPTAVAHDAVVAADSDMLCEFTLRGPALLIHPRVVPLLYPGSSLQSLSIVLSFPSFYAHGDADPVLSIFGNSPAILPNLTSFKLLLSAKASRSGVVALSSFLRDKRRLVRFDVSVMLHMHDVSGLRPVLELLPELPQLRTLGIHLDCGGKFAQDDLRALDESLPVGLSNLMLCMESCRDTNTQP
ncbi:uncharacterized protein TRAVEDRAFT_49865 [Trametes versicolor FP-101664 SS1]|uniref:uncharacterized protein n=1 Tax=Trametes versicolor (strain FP-101664) TaxID=717944 RepID=UPI0004623A16|nr:uncharacterized protein TRAVEDRAFT_49865 [Trametes versicolor FP-101664 SS1]EIW57053.1 hypothetical protein TRAVEDRAFT_49865 [Trametes versicolor FP-101664 SS1]